MAASTGPCPSPCVWGATRAWSWPSAASSRVPSGALVPLADAARVELTRPVKPGEIMTQAVLRPRLAIRRGEMVTVLLDGHGFRIRAHGRPPSAGRRGGGTPG